MDDCQENHYFTKMRTALGKLSASQEWPASALEWKFGHIERDGTVGQCLCGHPLDHNCYIINTLNDNEAVVGTSCMEKFLGEANPMLGSDYKRAWAAYKQRCRENNVSMGKMTFCLRPCANVGCDGKFRMYDDDLAKEAAPGGMRTLCTKCIKDRKKAALNRRTEADALHADTRRLPCTTAGAAHTYTNHQKTPDGDSDTEDDRPLTEVHAAKQLRRVAGIAEGARAQAHVGAPVSVAERVAPPPAPTAPAQHALTAERPSAQLPRARVDEQSTRCQDCGCLYVTYVDRYKMRCMDCTSAAVANPTACRNCGKPGPVSGTWCFCSSCTAFYAALVQAALPKSRRPAAQVLVSASNKPT